MSSTSFPTYHFRNHLTYQPIAPYTLTSTFTKTLRQILRLHPTTTNYPKTQDLFEIPRSPPLNSKRTLNIFVNRTTKSSSKPTYQCSISRTSTKPTTSTNSNHNNIPSNSRNANTSPALIISNLQNPNVSKSSYPAVLSPHQSGPRMIPKHQPTTRTSTTPSLSPPPNAQRNHS